MVIYILVALAPLALVLALVAEIRKLRRQVRWLETRIDMMLHPENYPPQHVNCRCTEISLADHPSYPWGGGPEFEMDRGMSQ